VKLNRIKTRAARKGMHWCFKCDRALIGHGQRCHVCHTRESVRQRQPFYAAEIREAIAEAEVLAREACERADGGK
jgi:hypothetical protein